jgi:ankyrin repeat protein
MTAAYAGDLATLRKMVRAGHNIDMRGYRGRTALACAANVGQDEAVALLLELGADYGTKDDDGYLPIHEAVRYGHATSARLLLEAGADPDMPDRINGWTALHHAVFQCDTRVIALLVQHGADPDTRGGTDETPRKAAGSLGKEIRKAISVPCVTDRRRGNKSMPDHVKEM